MIRDQAFVNKNEELTDALKISLNYKPFLEMTGPEKVVFAIIFLLVISM